jgi:transposase
MKRKAYPSDVSDEEWAFIAPYLRLMREDAPQREHSLREVFNGACWIVRAGAAWRMLHDLPPWHTVYQQRQCWIAAGVFAAMIHDLRVLLRVAAGHAEQPSAAIFDGCTIQSTPESAGALRARAGFDGTPGTRPILS